MGATPGGFLGTAQDASAVVLVLHLAEQLQAADDDGEQIVEVVRDAAGQLADRFQLLQLEQFGLRGSPRRGFRLDPLLQVRVQRRQVRVDAIQLGRAQRHATVECGVGFGQRGVRAPQFLGERRGFLEGDAQFLAFGAAIFTDSCGDGVERGQTAFAGAFRRLIGAPARGGFRRVDALKPFTLLDQRLDLGVRVLQGNLRLLEFLAQTRGLVGREIFRHVWLGHNLMRRWRVAARARTITPARGQLNDTTP